MRTLAGAGLRIGLISNTQRPLEEFATHFGLDGLIAASVSSAAHGFLKPHRAIFESALRSIGVTADEAVMVGDSVTHDIEGARQIGMQRGAAAPGRRRPAQPAAARARPGLRGRAGDRVADGTARRCC